MYLLYKDRTLADGHEFKETGMPLSNQKIPLRHMFPSSEVTQARVEELMKLEELKARTALSGLYSNLLAAKDAGQDVESLISLVNVFYTPAAVALGNRLSALGYTQAEISAALMVADGILVLDES